MEAFGAGSGSGAVERETSESLSKEGRLDDDVTELSEFLRGRGDGRRVFRSIGFGGCPLTCGRSESQSGNSGGRVLDRISDPVAVDPVLDPPALGRRIVRSLSIAGGSGSVDMFSQYVLYASVICWSMSFTLSRALVCTLMGYVCRSRDLWLSSISGWSLKWLSGCSSGGGLE